MFTPAKSRRFRHQQQDPALVSTNSSGKCGLLIEHPVEQGGSSLVPGSSHPAPAPWSSPSSPSFLARFYSDKFDVSDQMKPVFVGEFPPIVRIAQKNVLRKSFSDDTVLSGGLDKETSLAWMICGTELFVWKYLSLSASKGCVTLKIPSSLIGTSGANAKPLAIKNWIVCFVRWDSSPSQEKGSAVLEDHNSTGIILYSQRTHSVAYWPEIYSENLKDPVVCSLTQQFNGSVLSSEGVKNDRWNSVICAAIPGSCNECAAIACDLEGVLNLYTFAPDGITKRVISENPCRNILSGHIETIGTLTWQSSEVSVESERFFFFMTNNKIQFWQLSFAPPLMVSQLCSSEIVVDDVHSKDTAGQKHILLLDVKADNHREELCILVAILLEGKLSSVNYTQYALLKMQYKCCPRHSSVDAKSDIVFEKTAPLWVIIPRARFEGESFVSSMQLRIGAKPSDSIVILSSDGTSTVAFCRQAETFIYQFNLPWDAGKVLDASVFPPGADEEEVTWIVLTEKAGIWAIPEKPILVGGVRPPEDSLLREGSSSGNIMEEKKRNNKSNETLFSTRVDSDTSLTEQRTKTALTVNSHKTSSSEEAALLLNRLFQDFILSSSVDGVLEKLAAKGAFEKEGETNVFSQMSKSIVNTLAKHWTTREDLVASTVISSLLLDKQQKHQNYLQFLALSRCHELLCSKQRHSMFSIMEDGEKLRSMIELRVLQNSPSQQQCLSLWMLIELIGERSRKRTVLLLDRGNAEVFYSKVSDIEDLFYWLSLHYHYIVSEKEHSLSQVQRAIELANACVTVIRAALQYKNEFSNWYPSVEGLTPWYGQPVVRSGLWVVASAVMELLRNSEGESMSTRSSLWSHLKELADVLLEAYAASIVTTIELGEERNALLEEFSTRRDDLLRSLYECAKTLVQANYQEVTKGAEDLELKESLFREITAPILLLAKRHEGYQTLWNICYDLSDIELLQNLMRDSVGPRGGFCFYAFGQLLKSSRQAKLLRLGEVFQEELLSFLKEQKHLLWLHEIQLNQFSAVSDTLNSWALSWQHNDGVDERLYLGTTQRLPTLAERKRLLYLSKISGVAEGKSMGVDSTMKHIDADIQILKLQEDICNHLSNNGEDLDVNGLISPRKLIEMCLKKDGHLALKAFEVFAWTSSSFRSENRRLLEECWRNAAEQDDWQAIHGDTTAEGWSDETLVERLCETVLYRASRRCYGPAAKVHEGTFEEVLTVHRESSKAVYGQKEMHSVEDVLKNHKDFPDAGKYMLAAVVMGKGGSPSGND